MNNSLDIHNYLLSLNLDYILLILEKFSRRGDYPATCIDTDMDAKIGYLKTIPESLTALMKILSRYRRSHKALAKREKQLGCFMDESGKVDKTSAGKVLRVTGQFLYFISKSRKILDDPLDRLYQAIEIFTRKAVEDTFQALHDMEESRKVFDGSVVLFKRLTAGMDLNNPKSLQEFQALQTIVKRKKTKFEKRKIKALQKMDLLSLSRCNLLSTKLYSYTECVSSGFKEIVFLSKFAADVVQNTSNQSLSLTLQQLLNLPPSGIKDERKSSITEDNCKTQTDEELSWKESETLKGLNLMHFDNSKECAATGESESSKSLDSNSDVRNCLSSQTYLLGDTFTSYAYFSSPKAEVPGEHGDRGSCLSYLSTEVAQSSGPENLASWLEILNEFDPLNQESRRDICDSC